MNWELTGREREVLALIGEGLGDREIAARLHVARSTVRSHIKHIFQKLGVDTRTAAARTLWEREASDCPIQQ